MTMVGRRCCASASAARMPAGPAPVMTILGSGTWQASVRCHAHASGDQRATRTYRRAVDCDPALLTGAHQAEARSRSIALLRRCKVAAQCEHGSQYRIAFAGGHARAVEAEFERWSIALDQSNHLRLRELGSRALRRSVWFHRVK